MERARQRYGSADYRAAQGIMRDVLVRLVNERYDDALAAVRCPVELVWGDDDADVPVDSARALAAALPQAHLTVCPGAGHLLPVTAPAELRAAVERALTRGRVILRAPLSRPRAGCPSWWRGPGGCAWRSASTIWSTPRRVSPCGGGRLSR